MSGSHWLRAMVARLRALLGREAILRDIDEELESHLDLATDANIARGMPPAAARAAAVASFGGRGRVQDQAYDVRGGAWLETAWQDLRQGGRMLRRNPGFAAIALLTLTVGIGATTAIFSVVNAVLLRPLPYPEADRLVVLKTSQRTTGATYDSAMPDYRAWRDQTTAFEGLAGHYYQDMNLVGAGPYPERLEGARVSANLFSVLRVAPALGRGLRPEEEQFGRHQVVLLSHDLWQERFSGDPAIVGKTINLGGEAHVVVGVMPAGMAFFGNQPPVQLWTPAAFAPGDAMDSRGNHYVRLVGRLRPGVTLVQAQAQVDLVANRIEQQYEENKGLGGRLSWLDAEVVGNVRQMLLVLAGAVAFLLMVACVNVANLLLARAAGRERELAVRASLGAGRARIVRQLLLESLPLGLLGGGAGLLLAWGLTEALGALLPSSLPRHNEVRVDATVLAFALAVTMLTTALFAVLPAFQGARLNALAALKDGGRGATAGRRPLRLRALLAAGEIALSLVLLIGAGLMLQSFVKLRHMDLGFTGQDVLTMKVPLPEAKYPMFNTLPVAKDNPPPAGLAFYARLIERIGALPGVTAVGASTALPLGAGMQWGKMITVEGRPRVPSLDRVPLVQFALISPDYLRAMGIAVRRGRGFTTDDGDHSQPVALVNETAARQLFGGEDPVGRTLWLGPPEEMLPTRAQLLVQGRFPRRRVVGVVADVRANLRGTPRSEVYAPYTQSAREGWPNDFMLAVRSDEGAGAPLLAAIRQQVAGLDAEQPITDVVTMERRIHRALAGSRFNMVLLGLFAAVGLLLASIGVYGVMSQAVAQRTQEIGLRMALGAGSGNVLWMVVRQTLAMAVTGIACGLLGALAATRVMSRLLYGVSATDPTTFAVLAGILLLVALAACLVPAIRATRVHPVLALRSE
jgi:putative ABC transport system permease protein